MEIKILKTKEGYELHMPEPDATVPEGVRQVIRIYLSKAALMRKLKDIVDGIGGDA